MAQNTSTSIKLVFLLIVILGGITLIASTFFNSSFFAIFGLSLTFWGVILLYVMPSKNVTLKMINSVAKPNVDNTERIIAEYNLNHPGIYLQKENNSILFGNAANFPKSDEVLVFFRTSRTSKDDVDSKNIDGTGLFLTPPGQALSKLFEERIGESLSRFDIKKFKKKISNLLTTELKLVESLNVEIEKGLIKIEITKSVFEPNCQETNNKLKTHKLVGCLLTSALACMLVKMMGKPIYIKDEVFLAIERKTKIEYQIIEDSKS